jgi:hypothetical protein
LFDIPDANIVKTFLTSKFILIKNKKSYLLKNVNYS